MIPLHALALLLMGRFSNRLYVAYSSWYAIGTLSSMQVPFVGFQPVRTSEHMGALGEADLFFPRCYSRAEDQVSLAFSNLLHLRTLYALMSAQSSSKLSCGIPCFRSAL